MLSFQEQADIINHVYGNNLSISYFKEFINRGNDEEALFNYGFIHKVFKQRLNNMNLKNEFAEFVKFYIDLFIIHNDVYFKTYKNVNFNKQPYRLPIHKETALYDGRTNEIIVMLKWIDYRKNEIIFYPTWADNETKIPIIEFDDYEHLKELKNVITYTGRLWNNVPALAQYNKTIYEIVKNDNVDEFIDLCAQEPQLLTCEYNFANFMFIGIFEITILLNAIKCLKYILTCPERPKTISHEHVYQVLAISGSAECFRLLNQGMSKPCTPYSLIPLCLQYHSNDLAKHLLYTDTTPQFLKLYIKECLKSYNYEMLIFCAENFDMNALLSTHFGRLEICKDHMIALLGLYDEYDISLLESWHDVCINFISYPISPDYFMNVVNRVPMGDATLRGNLYKDYLYECFSNQKPISFINTISCFLCGSKVWDYNHENVNISKFNPIDLFIRLYDNNINVNLVNYIIVMFNTTFKYYTDSGLDYFISKSKLRNKSNELLNIRHTFIKFYKSMLEKMK